MGTRSGFGSTRKLPSGRWQARYTGPDLKRHTAPFTFDEELDAREWLLAKRREIKEDEWKPPVAPKRILFGDYAPEWITRQTARARKPLKPRSAAHYRKLLHNHLLPTFSDLPLRSITAESVQNWYDSYGRRTPTARANAYGLLNAIMSAAHREKKVRENPCQISGGAYAPRATTTKLVTTDELAVIVKNVPLRYRPMILLAAWCGLRLGELCALRRRDLDGIGDGLIRVERAVARVDGRFIEGTPKSEAGIRNVYAPPFLIPALREHLDSIADGPDALLFPSGTDDKQFMMPSTLYRVWYPAREAAGRGDLRFHDLRHAAGTWTLQAGATIKDVMERLGHTTPTMALRYQHSSDPRQKEIAERLGDLDSRQYRR